MRTRMTPDEIKYSKRKKMWFDTIYPLLKMEELSKDQIAKVGNKLSELALHLIETNKNESAD